MCRRKSSFQPFLLSSRIRKCFAQFPQPAGPWEKSEKRRHEYSGSLALSLLPPTTHLFFAFRCAASRPRENRKKEGRRSRRRCNHAYYMNGKAADCCQEGPAETLRSTFTVSLRWGRKKKELTAAWERKGTRPVFSFFPSHFVSQLRRSRLVSTFT